MKVRSEAGEITLDEKQQTVLKALRGLEGRATVGDVVAATGVPREQAELSLRDLLGVFRGQIAVGEKGDLLYSFDPKLIRRDHESWWTRFKRGAKRFLSAAFKVWIVLMLTVYFVIFVAILLGIMFGGNDRRGGRRGGRFPTFLIWYLFWTPEWRYGQRYYGQRWETRRGQKVPFYKKVFAFVFGPDTPALTQEDRDRDVLSLIRARRGVLTASELVEFTGITVEDSAEEMARLMGEYGGDVRVSSRGELTWVFPELMLSAHGAVRVHEPEPAWRRLEKPRVLTGNSTSTNTIIGFMNGFNLVAAASAPFTFLGTAAPTIAYVGLVGVPLVFSAFFFGIPLVRKIRLDRENRERRRRNIRKALLSVIYQAAVEENAVTVDGATMWVQHALADDAIDEAEVAAVLSDLATEFEADVEAESETKLRYRFPRVRQQLTAGEEVRSVMQLETQKIGDIVYDTGDTATQQSERELKAFDEQLRQRLPSPGRTAFVDDFETMNFAEPARRR
jgi:hypothetical protein